MDCDGAADAAAAAAATAAATAALADGSAAVEEPRLSRHARARAEGSGSRAARLLLVDESGAQAAEEIALDEPADELADEPGAADGPCSASLRTLCAIPMALRMQTRTMVPVAAPATAARPAVTTPSVWRRTMAMTALASVPSVASASTAVTCRARSRREAVQRAALTAAPLSGPVYAVAFSPSSRELIATGGEDDRAYIWRAQDGSVRCRMEGHSDTVSSVRFSNDGHLLTTAGLDGAVKLWRVEDGRHLADLDGADEVEWLQWRPGQNALLAAGSASGAVHLWSAPDGAPVGVLFGHTARVTAGAFTPTGPPASACRGRTG